ncbi:uncharacterized protein [Nicotiana sylvestris]|uniref:uncharacterized protein n=1 Tax=Nicotiana sylvestris TaxID=4096 RepID=UPI00388CA561
MANFILEEDRETKATEFEQLKQGNKNVQEYIIRLAKHAPHMVKTEKAKIRRFIGGLAYHIKDTTSAAAVWMIAFSSVVGFAEHLEKDRQQRREEKEHNKKVRTAGRFNGTSSGGGRDSSNKESLTPAQSSHQSGGGSSFRRHCKLGFHGCYHCGDIGHIKANCPKLRRKFSGGSTRPSSSSTTAVAPPQAHGSHNQIGHGASRGSMFSYVTPYFAINLGLEPGQLSEPFLVSTPVGKSVKVTRVYRGCIVSVQGHNTKADLIELEMVDFYVVMGMDWLSSCYAMLDCHAKMVRFQFPNEEVLEWKGSSASLVELEPPALQSLPIVREFPKVFPDDLPGLPPERIVDFGIDLMTDGLKKAIMEEAHSSRYSIYPGATKMYLYLKELYWWKGMKKQVADHVAKCLNCQQVKAEH